MTTARALLLGAALVAAGCGWFRSSINNSPGLRWWLFSTFGAQKICPEMLKRSVGLRPAPGANVIGRFFPGNCGYRLNAPSQTVIVQFDGGGLIWTPVAGRVGFTAYAEVEYRMDFFMGEDALYVFGEPIRMLRGPELKITAVESKILDWARTSPLGQIGDSLGAQIATSQIASGFTVVRTDAGDEFTLGRLAPPARPPKPFDLEDDERFTLANETTDVHAGQVDFLGPFEITEPDQALFLRFRVAGPPLDALLLQRGSGDLLRHGLTIGTPLGPPRDGPVSSWILNPGPEERRRVPLPPGQYYLLLDNSRELGVVAPPWSPLGVVGGGLASVSFTAELGESDAEF